MDAGEDAKMDYDAGYGGAGGAAYGAGDAGYGDVAPTRPLPDVLPVTVLGGT